MKNKYKFYKFHIDEKNKKVIAITHYAGRVIKGIAKCAPEDIFNLELGKRIAVARAEEKVAKAKARNAATKFLQASVAADAAEKRFDEMRQYYLDAIDQLDEVEEFLENLIPKGE